MIKTYAELRIASDEQVLGCINEMHKQNVATNEYKEKFGTDYNYTALSSELKARGYAQVWTKKEPKTITVKMSADNARMNLNMTKECKEKFEEFLKDKSYNFVHTSAALMLYMDAIKHKEVKVNIEVV